MSKTTLAIIAVSCLFFSCRPELPEAIGFLIVLTLVACGGTLANEKNKRKFYEKNA